MPAIPGVTDQLDREAYADGPNGQSSLFNASPMLAPQRSGPVAVADPDEDDGDEGEGRCR